MSTLTEVLIIIALILANSVLAMSEIAMISARKARLHQLAYAGDKSAQAALDIANSPSEFLSTVQIGITLVGIFAGAYGGATIAEQLAEYLKHIPALAPYSGIPLDDFKKLFLLDKLPGEDTAGYHTLAGFVLFHLERIPAAGEHFDWQDLHFEIVDIDRHRIDKLLVGRRAASGDIK